MSKAVAVVAIGASVSGAIRLGGEQLPGHLMTAAGLDGGVTTLSFDVAKAEDNDAASLVWTAKYVGGAELTMTVAASQSLSFNPADWLGTDWMRVCLGTHASPVTSASVQTFNLGTG